MNKIKNHKILKLLSGICAVVICVYFILKSSALLIPKTNDLLDTFIIAFLILGESYFLLLSLGYMFTIISISKDKPETHIIKKMTNEPPVAVIVAARHEPKTILEETFSTLKALDYENKNIYLLDDSSDEKFKIEADELGEYFNINIYRRDERHGAKAGIINDFLKTVKDKYIVIFDADQNPVPDFLKLLVPLMEENDNLAFIQTPQFYTNIDTGPVAKAATIQQAIFYESICEAKSSRNAMFCCGTNVIFRKDALMAINGFEENSITEDFATSIKFHLKGYDSLYYSKVSAFGMAPENLVSFFKQQARWSAGTADVLRRTIINFFKNPFKLKAVQWWEYLLSGVYYFVGWAFLIMMSGPILYLIFDKPAVYGIPEIYFFPFLLYFIMSVYIFYYSMHQRNYSISEIYHGIIITFLSFPVLVKSTFFGFFGKKMPFVVTTKGKAETLPLKKLLPYIILITLNLIAIAFGIKKISKNFFGISINIFWTLWHLFILSNIFYFNKKQKVL